MSKQRFDAAERQAIWLAHNKKCAYTGVLLDLNNLHIDHILKESLAGDPVAFAKVKKVLGLPDDFDIYGFENLLPCTQGVNLQKGDLVFDPPKAMYFLQIAASKVEKIKKNVAKFNSQINNAKGALLLQGMIEQGKISIEDAADILKKYSGITNDVFELLEGLSFVDKDLVKKVRKADISELRRFPIKLGLNTDIEGVELRNDNNQTVFVKTCLEYDDALEKEFYPYTTFDIKMASFFEHQCGLLKALETAQIPQYSFITNLKVGIVDLDLLPFDMYCMFDAQRENLTPGLTYQDKMDDGTLVVKRLKSNLLIVESSNMGQQLVEVARADFNGDGFEDIFLFEYCYAKKGTFGAGNIKIITRKSVNGLFEDI